MSSCRRCSGKIHLHYYSSTLNRTMEGFKCMSWCTWWSWTCACWREAPCLARTPQTGKEIGSAPHRRSHPTIRASEQKRISRRCTTIVIQSILRCTRADYVICDLAMKSVMANRCCLATPSLWQLQGHYKGSSVDRRTGLFPLNDTLRSWMEALDSA